jgi:lysozyme family protein
VNSLAHPEAVEDGFYNMPRDQALLYAQNLFKNWYWMPIHGDDILNQTVATKVVDLAFNMNVAPAVKIAQQAINSLLFPNEEALVVDGHLGPKTLYMLNRESPELVLVAIKKFATQHYQAIAAANPDLQKYLEGWLKRVNV